MNILIYLIIIYIVLIIISPVRYYFVLPTIPIYPNNEKESLEVMKYISKRSLNDEDFFKLTDDSVSSAFFSVVPESKEELNNMITSPHVYMVILFFKYIINRARPGQIKSDLNVLKSETVNTPAYPAGHALQAYYLAKVLGRKYPDLKDKLDVLAKKCDIVRVKAGLHYPSDGEFSKMIVDWFY